MLKFSKYFYSNIVNIGNIKGKQIINIYVHNLILGYYLIENKYYTKCKYAIIHFKNFNFLKDYINERTDTLTFTNHKEYQEKHINNKQNIFYNKENNNYHVIVNPIIYSQLKNIFQIIHKTNTSILQNILTKYKNVIPIQHHQIIKSNICIYKNQYLFYLQIPNEYINIILPEIQLHFKKEKTIGIFKQINNLDIYALISLFHIHTNVMKNVNTIRGNYVSTDRVEFHGLVSVSLSDKMTSFILNNLCVQIDKFFSNFKTKEINTTMNKSGFHKIYLELLDILNILIIEINKYIKFINFILNILLKSFHKYKHHYNYTYSVNLLNTLNQIIPFHMHSLYLVSSNEEDISNTFIKKIENNYFYIQKENFTWNNINKYYGEINPNNYLSEIKNEKAFISYSMDTEYWNDQFIHLNYNIENNKFWTQYCIILVTIIVKKIKYVMHRNVLIDEIYVLEAINTLLHIKNKQVLNLDTLIDTKAPFLKNLYADKLENSKGTDIDAPKKNECSEKKNNFLLFLNFSFNMLKNLRYNNTSLKNLVSKNKDRVEIFLKIISLISNIKYLLTSNINKCTSKNSMENVIAVNDHFIKRQNENIKNAKVINTLKKNINLFCNEIVLAFSNYHTMSKSFSTDFLSCTSQKNVAMYMSYIFNDIYFQNNSQIKNIILNHFLKHYNILNSNLETYNKKYIYLQYITIYNLIKLFHNDINNTSPNLYNIVLNIFMECFNNNTCYNLKNDKISSISYKKQKINYYLHMLNKLCYFYFLSKKYITNLEFLNHINHNFYLTFHLISQYIEKNINTQDYFTNFINKCANKIIIILTVHKFFNIYSEDLNMCVSNFIQLTHEYITKENKKKFILYIIPFLKFPKSLTDNLKRLLINADTNFFEEVNIQKEITGEKQLAFQNNNLRNFNQEDISCVECEKNESNLFKNEQIVSNNAEGVNVNNEDIFRNKQNDLGNIFLNYFKEHNYANQNVYPVSHIEKDLTELIENLGKNKNFQINNNTLYKILNEYMKENKLIKKENIILKNKLNFIVLNFEQFISSYINSISSNNSTTSTPTNNSTIFHCKENISAINTLIMNKSGKTIEKDINKNMVVGKNDTIQEKANYYKYDKDNVNKIKNMSTALQIQFDYHYVNAKNEYFNELKKYENKNYIKVNNILLNMYMYNPYISAKNNKKKLIILPYDTYKNIKKLVCEGNEGANVFKRFHNSVYFFFDKLMIFFCKTRN
ncbi:conserved Plasmodium protein, unknown function [Plasmodium berghei]|uniref:Uncharacterized protein n=2 Tax=Plasmodium berghei TaxID=5821 RepID=A0A509AET8_PLABA|nr:conserved Plasmodium protein, unknown function [Plasmodium berghei ANKA]CXH99565.1 conserved Plasmodium protein, unknown function [Plasmodium berghei]SCL91554.1 conserved Plasmodium protein, unknown function [Plasmodium berghei]SCM15488.1 conserved Plasmodium protein, unknown function [Plasmodium berghei]SCM17280.1 conserved Plasmodium protein, unknown function [Plasmodium berghei]SCN22447.1 conserved Plasmodium protein, unknown function [Plasmodium berghei]|eukprot:XP_034420086.1 conserved Plasmodium protein, unknown function [Plasmodium berghei ANKA]